MHQLNEEVRCLRQTLSHLNYRIKHETDNETKTILESVEMKYECHINYDDCDLCSECVECCSGKALTISNNQIQFQADNCTNCEVCDDVCPVGAICIETLGMRS